MEDKLYRHKQIWFRVLVYHWAMNSRLACFRHSSLISLPSLHIRPGTRTIYRFITLEKRNCIVCVTLEVGLVSFWWNDVGLIGRHLICLNPGHLKKYFVVSFLLLVRNDRIIRWQHVRWWIIWKCIKEFDGSIGHQHVSAWRQVYLTGESKSVRGECSSSSRWLHSCHRVFFDERIPPPFWPVIPLPLLLGTHQWVCIYIHTHRERNRTRRGTESGNEWRGFAQSSVVVQTVCKNEIFCQSTSKHDYSQIWTKDYSSACVRVCLFNHRDAIEWLNGVHWRQHGLSL